MFNWRWKKIKNHMYSPLFRYSKVINGKYIFKGDTIIFKKPYDNEWLPDTLLLDKNANTILKEKDKNTGEFITEKHWLNHFIIKK